jgi:small subunit ribosomal protein S6
LVGALDGLADSGKPVDNYISYLLALANQGPETERRSMPNLYETLLIVTPEADEDGVNAVIGDLRATIEADGGTVLQAGVWQRRQLAYQVKGKTEGIYVLIYADGEHTLPYALKDRMKLDEAVIRSMVVRLEDQQEADVRAEIAAADHSAEGAEIEAQRAAAEARAEAEAAAAAMSLEELAAAEEAAAEEGAEEGADAEADGAKAEEAEETAEPAVEDASGEPEGSTEAAPADEIEPRPDETETPASETALDDAPAGADDTEIDEEKES